VAFLFFTLAHNFGDVCPSVKATRLTNIKASELQIRHRLFNRLCKFI